jgi:hypothetical protein
VLLVPGLALVALPGFASTVVGESIEALAQSAPVVVRATVRGSQSGWDDGRHRIWTWTELSITESIKGAPPRSVLVKQPGGEVGAVGQAVTGTAKFTPGEDVVLFLQPAPDEPKVYLVRGLAAGKVLLTSVQGQPQALRVLDGLELTRKGRLQVQPSGAEANLGTPSAFLSRVRQAVKAVAQ